MKEYSEYVNQLKKLTLQIQTRVGRLDTINNEQLVEAAKWECPTKKERKLLDDLIIRAKEFIQLERIVKEHKCSRDMAEKYFYTSRWFTSINMLLETFDVPLSQVSFTDLTLKD